MKPGVILLLVAGLVGATEPASEPSPAARFQFAVPDFPSHITLWVENPDGHLIRLLCAGLPEDEFHAGRDGLVEYWDGLDDSGNQVPGGSYMVRGLALGQMEIEGVAFAGNDWVAEFGAGLPLAALYDFAGGPDGSLVVLGALDDGRSVLFCYDPGGGGLRWTHVLDLAGEARVWQLAAAATEWVALAGGGDVVLLEPSKGIVAAAAEVPFQVVALGLSGEELVLVGPGRESRLTLPTLGPVSIPAADMPELTRLGSCGETLLGLDRAGGCWGRLDGRWRELLPEHPLRFLDFADSGRNTFWAVVENRDPDAEPSVRVGEFSPDGEFLRQIAPESLTGRPEQVVVSGAGDLFVFSRDATRRELVGIRKSRDEAAQESGWEIFLRKVMDAAAAALPSEFNRLPVIFEIQQARGLQAAQETVRLRIAISPPASVVLFTGNGIPVAELLRTADIHDAGAKLGDEGLLRLWVTTRGRAEEYRLSGFDRIVPLEVGSIRWPPEDEEHPP